MAIFKNLENESTLNAVVRVVLATMGAGGVLACTFVICGGLISFTEGGDRVVDGVMLVCFVLLTYGSYLVMRKGLNGDGKSSGDAPSSQRKSPDIHIDPSRQSTEEEQREALRLARDLDGRLTVAELALETSLSIDEARALLEELTHDGVAELQLTDAGNNVYVFGAFVDGGRQKLSARSMLDDDVELEFDKLAEQQKQD